ncbi:hypothetical protein [Arthrobacter russicus]|jgi:hypothetical protein|uniref:Uncharacterized protein n=1 Tax=Arthrobacter russicus TaxID=172040 RepID=A0ABU1JEN2_9MICC|nr:hypothetical protein [Arthrobacter russicus]MDR6270875.1 hypothetical protein [Arthrobacter russicus]
MGSVTAVLPDPAGNPLPNYVASNPEFFTPLGCAEGWMAFELNDRGSAALGVSPGQNSYNYFARKKGEKYEFAMLSLQKYNRNTPSDLQIQLMEEQFTRIGIPAQLREALIGNPPV